jgi:hypothetical protein
MSQQSQTSPSGTDFEIIKLPQCLESLLSFAAEKQMTAQAVDIHLNSESLYPVAPLVGDGNTIMEQLKGVIGPTSVGFVLN